LSLPGALLSPGALPQWTARPKRPRLEVASPADRPITCITLETIIAFAGRLKGHVAHCPASSYVQSASDWEKTRVDYAARFIQNRCKRTF